MVGVAPWGKKGEKTVQIVEIPDGWEDIKPSERISLAVALGAKRIGLTGAKADEVIATEVERRKAAAEREQEAEEPKQDRNEQADTRAKPEFEPES